VEKWARRAHFNTEPLHVGKSERRLQLFGDKRRREALRSIQFKAFPASASAPNRTFEPFLWEKIRTA
jgi:hypothetical protein